MFGAGSAHNCIICGMGGHAANEIPDTARLLYGEIPPEACKLVIFETADWNGDFSPWPAAPVFGREPFTGKAAATLEWLEGDLLPFLREQGILAAGDKLYLAGYSLAALFALWAFLESDAFQGAASCSGSLWFPHWMDYLRAKSPRREGIVYLSLGSKEEKTSNKVMSAVGDNTRETCRLLKANPRIKKTALEWNKGGHFASPKERLIKGMLWLLRQGS